MASIRASVRGEVIVSEVDTFNPEKPKIQLYLRQDDPRYSDRIEGPMDLLGEIKIGERVEILCSISSQKSKAGNAYLSVWAVEVLDRVEMVGAKK